MSDPAVQFSAADAIGVITLNRPDNREVRERSSRLGRAAA